MGRGNRGARLPGPIPARVPTPSNDTVTQGTFVLRLEFVPAGTPDPSTGDVYDEIPLLLVYDELGVAAPGLAGHVVGRFDARAVLSAPKGDLHLAGGLAPRLSGRTRAAINAFLRLHLER